jgi:hypothetical protein
MLAMKKQTKETTLKLFRKSPEQGNRVSVFQVTGELKPKLVDVKTPKLLPKEHYACDMATD